MGVTLPCLHEDIAVNPMELLLESCAERRATPHQDASLAMPFSACSAPPREPSLLGWN